MSTSLLTHAFGIPTGYEYQRTHYAGGEVSFVIKEKKSHLRCAICESRNVILRGSHLRRFRTLPIGNRPVWIEYAVPRLECSDCQSIRQARIRFANGSVRYTRRFRTLVLILSRHMTIKAVADYLHVGWDLVKDIQKKHLLRRYGRPNIRKLKRIAIDEIYMGKGSGYLTVVLDLQRGVVVHVGNGKSGEALEKFWRRLKRAKVELEVVATDMGSPFIKSARDNQPGAVNVVDHFHVIKLFNEKLTTLRRDMQRDAEDAQLKEVLKGTRWLLLMSTEKLNAKSEDARERLNKALALNEPLAKAYYLKDELRMIWHQANKKEASRALTDWIQKAEVAGVAMLKSFARTLARLRHAILAYYDFDGLSSGPMEGSNNKIKTIHKTAYGYRDMEFFKLKILSMHESRKDAFAG
ncbi:MAG: ISL3 family transposase [Mariprofundaceae bacterium]|nr:ISL3 family transposase [Mariprofundaceae bacterium]